MTVRIVASSASAVALTLAACSWPGTTATPGTPPTGVVEDCSTSSQASFPGAFSDPHDLVVGPLVLVGAADVTPASTIRDVGGNKFPALVKAGHRVTVALSPRTRAVAGLGYGPLPQEVELTPRDGHRVVTFVACGRGEDSGSDADGQPVTFWSGFVLTSSPTCVPLDVWVDDEPSPRRAVIRMGVPRCASG